MSEQVDVHLGDEERRSGVPLEIHICANEYLILTQEIVQGLLRFTRCLRWLIQKSMHSYLPLPCRRRNRNEHTNDDPANIIDTPLHLFYLLLVFLVRCGTMMV